MIKGFIKHTILAGAVATAAFATQITSQIRVGTGTGGVNGLTGTGTGFYLNSSANCIGAQAAQAGFKAGFTGCTAPAVGLASQRNYNTTLWAGSIPAQAGPNGEPSGLQYTDPNNGVVYAMVNEGTSAATGANYWAITNTTIKIPTGIFEVAESVLRRPVRLSWPVPLARMPSVLAEPEFATLLGMVQYAQRTRLARGAQQDHWGARLKALLVGA